MSAWKNLNQQDVYTTTYVARKSWTIPSQSLADYNIQVLYGETGSNSEFYLSEGTLYSGSNVGNGEYQELVHKSLEQLYYKSFNSSSGELETSSSYEHYLSSTTDYNSRRLGENVLIYSIPRNLIGTHIVPGSFSFQSGDLYVDIGFVDTGYVDEATEDVTENTNGSIISSTTGQLVGNIIYEHGLVIITDKALALILKSSPAVNLFWKSNQPIYTYNYNIKLSDYEFNLTLNPTALSGSNGDLADNVTGSYFQPYITTVGLYNDSNELIAVGKLSQPLPKSNNTETTIQIKLDI